MKKLLLLFLIISTACSSDDDAVNNNIVDTIAPVVTLVGDNPQTILQGDNYTELGVVSVDNIDGDITNNVEITTNVDLLQLGNYTVTYKSVDISNNTTIIIRDVIVDDPIIGSWTLINEEWVGAGDWPSGQPRGCFMSSDAGSPDIFFFHRNKCHKKCLGMFSKW